MSTPENRPGIANAPAIYDPMRSETGPVSALAPRPGKMRPRGKAFDSTRARAAVEAREARRRERRGSTAVAGARSPSVGAGSRAAADLAVVEPIVLPDLVEAPDGSLTVPESLKIARIDASPRPAGETLANPRSPRLPGKADLAMPASARRPAPQDLAELEPVEQAPEPAEPAPPDPEATRIAREQQTARGRVARRHLADRLANPQRAQFSIPWEPAVPKIGGICSGCGVKVAADRRAGHAVQQVTRFPRGQKERCVLWALGVES